MRQLFHVDHFHIWFFFIIWVIHLISRQLTQFNPRKIAFLTNFSCTSIFFVQRRECHEYQKIWNFLSHLLIYVNSLSQDVHLPKRPRKSLKMSSSFLVPMELVPIWNDFWRSTIWAIQIQVTFAEFENPGIQPRNQTLNQKLTSKMMHGTIGKRR